MCFPRECICSSAQGVLTFLCTPALPESSRGKMGQFYINVPFLVRNVPCSITRGCTNTAGCATPQGCSCIPSLSPSPPSAQPWGGLEPELLPPEPTSPVHPAWGTARAHTLQLSQGCKNSTQCWSLLENHLPPLCSKPQRFHPKEIPAVPPGNPTSSKNKPFPSQKHHNHCCAQLAFHG